MSSAPDTLPSSRNSSPTSLHSVLTDGTCINEPDIHASENESLEDSKSTLSKTPAIDDKSLTGVDGLVHHMVEGAQRVADVDDLLEAVLKSFKVVEQWYAATPVCVQPSPAKLCSYLFYLQFL
jgi:hypothetical protein